MLCTLRQVTTMFINLDMHSNPAFSSAKPEEQGMMIHHALCALQRAVYRYEGSYRTFAGNKIE